MYVAVQTLPSPLLPHSRGEAPTNFSKDAVELAYSGGQALFLPGGEGALMMTTHVWNNNKYSLFVGLASLHRRNGAICWAYAGPPHFMCDGDSS